MSTITYSVSWKSKEKVIESINDAYEIVLSELTMDPYNNFVYWTIVKNPINKKQEIRCFVLDLKEECWGYLEMPISSHPFYYCCPAKFLYLCPEDDTTTEMEKEFRKVNLRLSKY